MVLPLLFLILLSCSTRNEADSLAYGKADYINEVPIILLHGFNGFPRDEYGRFFYWGGGTDLEGELRQLGYDVRTACVGPVSSNWDRSCEFYACLKGGRVDYGAHHAREAGHERYGRTYPGIFPEWGQLDRMGGAPQKVHIIAHSMGGTTARMVSHILREGVPAEGKEDGASPFFGGGKDWIASITTLSTPHDGTTLTYYFKDYKRRELLAVLGKNLIPSSHRNIPLLHDLQLDHWPWTIQKEDESNREYRKRLEETLSRWRWSNKDFSDYDLSPQGAWEMNGWVKASPRTYHFSWSTRITTEEIGTPYVSPNLPLLFLTHLMDDYSSYQSSLITLGPEWYHNDGVVNSVSQNAPELNSTDKSATPGPISDLEKGIWYHMGEFFPLDHQQILGWTRPLTYPDNFPGLIDWYRGWIDFLLALKP